MLFVAGLAGAGGPACASGGTLHIYMSELAMGYVRDPALKQFLEQNRNVALWASWYPDSGYVAGNEYGEFSHWMPFLDAYREYIVRDVGRDDPDYALLVAHLLGASAHSLQDQVFDHLFLIKTGEVDGTGQAELDMGLDMVCMKEHARGGLRLPDEVAADPGRYTPVRHLTRVYEILETPYQDIEVQILKGQKMLAMGIGGERMFYGFSFNKVRRASPWGARHYYEAPGGIEHNARLTAAYWDALWKKLNNEPAPLVIATFPDNNTQILSVNHATVDSHISVFFSGRYDQATVNGDTFLVRDAAGARVAGAFAWCYGSNMVRFMPDADLAPHSRYTVTLTTGLRDVAGAPLPEDFVFAFTTP